MVDIELKPFPGEDDISFSKRKAYFIRIVKPRMNYGNTVNIDTQVVEVNN